MVGRCPASAVAGAGNFSAFGYGDGRYWELLWAHLWLQRYQELLWVESGFQTLMPIWSGSKVSGWAWNHTRLSNGGRDWISSPASLTCPPLYILIVKLAKLEEPLIW